MSLICFHKYHLRSNMTDESVKDDDSVYVYKRCFKCGKKKSVGVMLTPETKKLHKLRAKYYDLQSRSKAVIELEEMILEKGFFPQFQNMHGVLVESLDRLDVADESDYARRLRSVLGK